MRSLFIFSAMLVATASLTAACNKHEASPGPVASASDPAASSSEGVPSPRGPGPMAPPPASVVVPDTGDVNATLGQLSLELRKYVVRTRTVPKIFEEFLAKSNVQPPPAPAGQKYEIQGQVIVLVKK
jgi:hypothetical protein